MRRGKKRFLRKRPLRPAVFLLKLLTPLFDLVIRLLSPILALFVRQMSRTGAGTGACLFLGCLPLPVHFYSPVPDLGDLERRGAWDRKSALAGISFREEEQLALLETLGREFGQECAWPAASKIPGVYSYGGGGFSFGCAAGVHCLARKFKPRRFVEIGSGNSSLVINEALAKNARETGEKALYTIIDPYPREKFIGHLSELTELREQKAETVDAGFFHALGENDFLFIDSSHTVRTGGDVNFLLLEVVPALAPGVLVHCHDILLPYEYPKVYATNPRFRVFWTEQYLLQALLSGNRHLEILLAMCYLMRNFRDKVETAFPAFRYDPANDRNISSSFWFRKTSDENNPGQPSQSLPA